MFVCPCVWMVEKEKDSKNRGIGEQRKRTFLSAQSKLLNRTGM